jgi:hypothetical protein
MGKLMIKMLKIILVLCSLSVIQSCQNKGTDVGNPVQPDVPQKQSCPVGYNCYDKDPCAGARCALPPYIDIHQIEICKTLSRCSGATDDFLNYCMNATNNQPGLGEVLNLNYQNYKELGQAYRDKKIIIQKQNYNSCMKTLNEISCDNSWFKEAFDVSKLEDFSRIHQILYSDEACLKTYEEYK